MQDAWFDGTCGGLNGAPFGIVTLCYFCLYRHPMQHFLLLHALDKICNSLYRLLFFVFLILTNY